jgi:3,4-dihydroxy 2-butanone 4-phosphate synthase/GTP cyclohydrolase II
LTELKNIQGGDKKLSTLTKMDNKDFGIGAQILHDLNIQKIKLMSNAQSNTKRVGMIGYGLEIVDYVTF